MSSDTGWKTAADTKVDLRSRPSATSVTQCITDQLTTNSKNRLKKLHIRANYLTTSCVEYIAHQLPFLETLTVDIQHYRADVFSSDTCTALQLPDFLDKVNMLRAVDIRWNNINQNDTHTMYNVFNKLIAACLGTSMSYNKGIVGGIYNIKVTAKIMWGGVNFFRLRKSCNQRLIEINVYDSKYERNLLSALQNLSNINCSTIIVDVEFRTVCGLFNGDLLGAIKEVLRLCPKVRHIQFGKRYYGEQYLRASSECLEVLLHPITTSSNSFKTTALLNNNDAEDTVLPSLLHLKIVGLHVNRVFRQNNDGGKSYSLQPIINYTVPYVKYLAMIDCRLEAGEHRNAIINLQCLQHVHELILELKANFANIKDVYLIVQKQPQDVTNIVYYRCRLKRFKKNVFEKTTGDQQKRLNLRSTFSYNIWCNQIDYLRVNLQYRRTSIMSDLTLCANPIISNSGM
ncbi:hypothetical protein BDF20DRAFT_864644 [Mycotypha africana]|uniref:uncharacterized protein n=1 Tax=Mycotypha africana TaxID=64632 RepID=UPI002300C0E7|nr:uncharacterized protein BDF20DRAFT_864644 [Mycotypha africana]KAI8982034.1 hypothetical protein BDF20DRAFT_864644 [Mycotypha africana]